MDFSLKSITPKLLAELGALSAAQSGGEVAPFAKVLLEAERVARSTPDGQAQLGDDTALLDACRQLEALFLNMMLSQMRQTLPKGGILDGGRAEEFFTSLLDENIAAEAAAGGATGLAELLYLQLKQAAVDGGDKK